MTDDLLRYLQQRANRRGLVVLRDTTLLDALRCSADSLQAALAELAKADQIEVLAPPPWLVAKIRVASEGVAPEYQSLSGAKPEPARTPRKSEVPEARAYSFQRSLLRSKQSLMKESYRPPGGEEEALLDEILATLGESDPTTFRGALRAYSPVVIRKTLTRIRKMQHVRKNRTALFRYLLPRIAK